MGNNIDVLAPLQQSIYTRLTGDATLMADITGVYDHVPEGTQFPYVTIGAATAIPRGAHDRYGRRTTETLHVWSAHNGWSEAYDIVGHLIRLLELQPLTATGHAVVSVRLEQTVSMIDPDADLRHIAVRFAIETEHEAA